MALCVSAESGLRWKNFLEDVWLEQSLLIVEVREGAVNPAPAGILIASVFSEQLLKLSSLSVALQNIISCFRN